MDHNLVEIGLISPIYSGVGSGRYFLKYEVEMHHNGLDDFVIISTKESEVELRIKINQQVKKWEKKWAEFNARQIQEEKEKQYFVKAESRTKSAIEDLHKVDNFLIDSTIHDKRNRFNDFLHKVNFVDQYPEKPIPKIIFEYPPEPQKKSKQYSIFEKNISRAKRKESQEDKSLHVKAMVYWNSKKEEIDVINENLQKITDEEMSKWAVDVTMWKKNREAFLQKEKMFNSKIKRLQEGYENQDPKAIVEYCTWILNFIEYPPSFPKNFQLEYCPISKTLRLDHELPKDDALPSVLEVSYCSTRDEFEELHISESQRRKMFDETLYKITLRIIHELFVADTIHAVDVIDCSGWVGKMNRSIGKYEKIGILTIEVKKKDMLNINLSQVDPKACFENLSGNCLKENLM